MRVLFADNSRLLRDGVRIFLAKLSRGCVILEAESFNEAIIVTEKAGGVDLALLGQGMSGLNGATGVCAFHERFPLAKVVLLTSLADPISILATIKAGACGVILNTITGEGLLNALRLVLSGEIYLPSNVLMEMANLVINVTAHNKRLTIKPRAPVNFSPSETVVIPFLLEGLSNKVMAEKLAIKEATVKARLRCINKKLGVSTRTQAVAALLASGSLRQR